MFVDDFDSNTEKGSQRFLTLDSSDRNVLNKAFLGNFIKDLAFLSSDFIKIRMEIKKKKICILYSNLAVLI